MSSVLTNKGAMIALETLRGINKSMAKVQSEISTGKKISTSSDNAAIWSIAKVMESDVKSFSQITDSLNLGSATVGVAQSAANQVTSLLQDAKSLIVAANDASVTDGDREKYQTDISELVGTITNIVDAASFNGQNLLKGVGEISVLAALNRAPDGTVTAGNIAINRNDLSTEVGVASSVTVAMADEVGATITTALATHTDGGDAVLTITDGEAESRTDYQFTVDGPGGTDIVVQYSADTGSTQDQIAAGIAQATNEAIASAYEENNAVDLRTLTATASGGVVSFKNLAAGAANNVSITTLTVLDGGVEAGGLAGFDDINISTAAGAETALASIDTLLQAAIDATAEFGSRQKRIDNQNEFIITLTDSLKNGVGAMTDANLEEASARLQSLQVQQQLGTQSLSIANQAPQALLQNLM